MFFIYLFLFTLVCDSRLCCNVFTFEYCHCASECANTGLVGVLNYTHSNACAIMIVSVSDADELLLSLSRKRRRQSVNAEDDNDRKEGDELNPGHELDVEMQQQMILVQDEKGGCGALYCDAISLFSLNPDELKAGMSPIIPFSLFL
jgi:hypothetical protein